jgi:hypothetical protein
MCLTTLVHVAESEIDNEGRFNSGKIWMYISNIYTCTRWYGSADLRRLIFICSIDWTVLYNLLTFSFLAEHVDSSSLIICWSK